MMTEQLTHAPDGFPDLVRLTFTNDERLTLEVYADDHPVYAEAPAMYEALVEAVGFLEENYDHNDAAMERADAIRAILARIEGRTA